LATSVQEAQWVLRAQCGDRDALELVLRNVQPALRRYVAGLVGADDADDILQDVLVILSRKLYWLEQPTVFRAWAFRIASRAAFRHLRKRKRWQDATVNDAALDEVAARDMAASNDSILDLLDSPALTPASRAVLVLHFREDMPLAAREPEHIELALKRSFSRSDRSWRTRGWMTTGDGSCSW
jgi:RNA polymerase sigma-70 factor (ECF subfamily)